MFWNVLERSGKLVSKLYIVHVIIHTLVEVSLIYALNLNPLIKSPQPPSMAYLVLLMTLLPSQP